MKRQGLTIARTATESLKILWAKGFFKTWKSYSQIVKNLADNGYNFSTPELGMALKRAKHLTRRGKRTSYEYIQKHPFINDKEK